MRELPLTQGQVALVDGEVFEILANFRWRALWSPLTQSFYAQRGGGGSPLIHLHTEVWKHYHGSLPDGHTVDHIDRDALNNQLCNLRLATSSQQNLNRRIQRSNTSGYRGVSWRESHQKYRAYISPPNAKPKHLGYFETPEEAARAYNAAALQYHGQFAQLNEVGDLLFPSRH